MVKTNLRLYYSCGLDLNKRIINNMLHIFTETIFVHQIIDIFNNAKKINIYIHLKIYAISYSETFSMTGDFISMKWISPNILIM